MMTHPGFPWRNTAWQQTPATDHAEMLTAAEQHGGGMIDKLKGAVS